MSILPVISQASNIVPGPSSVVVSTNLCQFMHPNEKKALYDATEVGPGYSFAFTID